MILQDETEINFSTIFPELKDHLYTKTNNKHVAFYVLLVNQRIIQSYKNNLVVISFGKFIA